MKQIRVSLVLGILAYLGIICSSGMARQLQLRVPSGFKVQAYALRYY